MKEIDIIASQVVSGRTQKKSKIKSMIGDLARLRVEQEMTYRELTEVFERATGMSVSENYVYQQIRSRVAELEAEIEAKKKAATGGNHE